MKRFASIIAATAAAAAVAAAISLPAGADDGPPDELATLTSCLRSHGVAVPDGLEPIAFKRWLGNAADSSAVDAALRDCKMSLAPGPSEGPVKPGACGGDARPTDDAAKPDAVKQGAAEPGI